MNALFLGLGNTDYLNRFNGLNDKIAVAAADRPELLHYLPSMADQSYEAVFVAAELIEQANENSFANWLRIVKKSGSLFLENSPANRSALIRGLSLIEPFVQTVEAMDAHTTAVRKKDGGFPPAHYVEAALVAETEGLIPQTHYHYTIARTAAPADTGVAQSLALFYHRQGRFDLSEQIWQQMRLQRPVPQTELALALEIMLAGDYPRGFRIREQFATRHFSYERRSHAYPPPSGSLRDKRWQGEDLTGKTLAVWSEFGLGDELMFASLAHFFKRKTGLKRLIWVVQPPLVPLLATCADIDRVADASRAQTELSVEQIDFLGFSLRAARPCAASVCTNPAPDTLCFRQRQKNQTFRQATAAGQKIPYRFGVARFGRCGTRPHPLRSRCKRSERAAYAARCGMGVPAQRPERRRARLAETQRYRLFCRTTARL